LSSAPQHKALNVLLTSAYERLWIRPKHARKRRADDTLVTRRIVITDASCILSTKAMISCWTKSCQRHRTSKHSEDQEPPPSKKGSPPPPSRKLVGSHSSRQLFIGGSRLLRGRARSCSAQNSANPPPSFSLPLLLPLSRPDIFELAPARKWP
jgi:hypothetical protein